MQKKGLCETCVNDKDCTFPRKFPVLQCEEFSDYVSEPTKHIDVKKKKNKATNEITIEE